MESGIILIREAYSGLATTGQPDSLAGLPLPHFTHQVSPWVQTADQMIDEFCMELGGYERAMPVTRTVFKNSKCDFEKLNSDDLEGILDSLTDIIMDEKGPDIADEFRDKMKAMISEQIKA